MYVSAYKSRLVLHIRKVGDQADQRPFVMMFADAKEKFGTQVAQSGLGEAYKRAGRAFVDQMEQNFVVLKENLQDLNFNMRLQTRLGNDHWRTKVLHMTGV